MASLDFGCEITNSMPYETSFGNLACIPPDPMTTRSLLLVAATGLGKTVMMAGLANHWPAGRVMMISHRFELNQQALKTFAHYCGEEVGLEQASFTADQYGNKDRIVVASVQSLISRRRGKHRMEKFDPNEFGLLMVDEAHRSVATSYQRVFDHFTQNPRLKVIGVTATPDRLDGIGMGCAYQKVICDYNIRWGVDSGWLVPPRQKFVQINGLDLQAVRTVGGDLDSKQLSKIVEVERNLHEMAEPIVSVAERDKQTIVFTASVKQAHRLAELLRDYHCRKYGSQANPELAVSLDGSMSPQDPRRRRIVRDFKDGRIQFLVNCGVATEGFDAPNVKLIAVGRPTKSRALYCQMVGRGTRPLPGSVEHLSTPEERIAAIQQSNKPDCVVLDFMGQSGRHALVCTTDILAGSEPPDIQERARAIAKKKDFDGTTMDAIREAQEEAARIREARRVKATVGVDYSLQSVDTLYDMSQISAKKKPGYLKGKGVSDKQYKFMLRLGFTAPQIAKMDQRKASAAIDYAIKHPRNGFGKWVQRQQAKNGGRRR